MKVSVFTALFLLGSIAFAGHPASDRVTDAFDEAARIHAITGSGKSAALCKFIDQYVDHAGIAIRLLGNYAQSPDKAGVNAFRAASDSIMVSKAMPELQKYAGESGSYTVSPNASSRGSGYAVGVTVRAKGKSYNATVILNSAMKIIDAEYIGFSGVSYAGRDLRKDIDALKKKTATPVSQYVKELQARSDYVDCH